MQNQYINYQEIYDRNIKKKKIRIIVWIIIVIIIFGLSLLCNYLLFKEYGDYSIDWPMVIVGAGSVILLLYTIIYIVPSSFKTLNSKKGRDYIVIKTNNISNNLPEILDTFLTDLGYIKYDNNAYLKENIIRTSVGSGSDKVTVNGSVNSYMNVSIVNSDVFIECWIVPYAEDEKVININTMNSKPMQNQINQLYEFLTNKKLK